MHPHTHARTHARTHPPTHTQSISYYFLSILHIHKIITEGLINLVLGIGVIWNMPTTVIYRRTTVNRSHHHLADYEIVALYATLAIFKS